MRYIRFFILAVFLFLCMIFFFQNQAPLSQEMILTLNLFFIPPMTSMALPFYFLLIASFFVGALLCWLMLIWDRFNISAKYHKEHWKVAKLEKQVSSLEKDVAENRANISAYHMQSGQAPATQNAEEAETQPVKS